MAKAYEAAPQAHENSHENSHEVILEISGLTQNGDGTFTLRGVTPVEIGPRHMEPLVDHLIEQGISKMTAYRLTEEAAEHISTRLLSETIAQRTRRMG